MGAFQGGRLYPRGACGGDDIHVIAVRSQVGHFDLPERPIGGISSVSCAIAAIKTPISRKTGRCGEGITVGII